MLLRFNQQLLIAFAVQNGVVGARKIFIKHIRTQWRKPIRGKTIWVLRYQRYKSILVNGSHSKI